ncbi:MAG: aspartate aminotransferase family protein [Synoicihabitans sp.]
MSSEITRLHTADLYDAHVLNNYGRAPITVVRGRGSRVWDDEGKVYLDYTSGIAVSALGHCHPRWVSAVQQQAGELIHASNLFRNPLQGELAKRLVHRAGPGRVFFCNSGAEANEGLLKLARLHGMRKTGEEGKCYKVIGAENAFHGRTFGGMSATPQEKIQGGFRPLLSGFSFGKLNDLESFARLIDKDTAAIFLETVQGEGGINPATPDFLRGLRKLCSQHDILLLLDEVQCGVGRTGAFFAFEHADVRPDAIGMAKGLGGGFPIGAIWISETSADLFKPGSHGTTFGGTPLACSAALAVLDILEEEGLLAHVRELSPTWHEQLRGLASEFPQHIKQLKGIGFMVGLEMTDNALQWVGDLRDAGLLAPPAGGNVVRLLPPLNSTAEELGEAVAIFRKVLAAR